MPIATAPALLIGVGARILLDQFNRSDGPFVKDFVLVGVWQGVALHYATKTSGTSGFGILVAFGIAAKLFIEFNVNSDVTRCVTTILGVALGVVFTDFLSQYFDKPPQSSRRRKKSSQPPTPVKREKRRERLTQVRPSAHGGITDNFHDLTEVGTSLAATSLFISDITSVDSNSDKLGPTSSMSPPEREIHVLRTRAALADSERRRCKEERKWAVSQGNVARAQQMKWEVKRYTDLMNTFNQEADMKAFALEAANGKSRTRYWSTNAEEQKSMSPSSKEKSPKSSREQPVTVSNALQSNERVTTKRQPRYAHG